MDPTVVDDAEDLYRSIRANSNEYAYQDGKLYFSSTAFDDRNMRPSVDRSAIRTNATDARKSRSDGIAMVLTADVRKSCSVEIIEDGKVVGNYAVDVIHRPIEKEQDQPDNPAHCQIECNPAIANKSRFKRLKAGLANLANKHGFVVQPNIDPV